MTTKCDAEQGLVYAGSCDVEDGCFTLDAAPFIPREDEVSFLFKGYDEDGDFQIEGIAHKTENGFYMAPRCELKYRDYSGDYTASIRIDSISYSEKKEKCKVDLVWIQEGEETQCKCSLRLVRPK